MAYQTHGLIDAATYNTFIGTINGIYADTHSGATAESSADFGYGILPNLPTIATGNDVTAAQWTALFGRINLCGTHQGISVAPIPSSVTPGQLIVAYNNYLSPQTLTDVLSGLTANRLKVAIGQYSLIAGTGVSSSTSWLNNLRYTCQVDFGSWDNARYFFNSGGGIAMAGSHVAGAPLSSDTFWSTMLTGMGTLKMEWHDTIPTSGAGSNEGFYDLTTSYKEVYRRNPILAGVYYTSNYISVSAKLTAAAGTNGLVDIRIDLIDNDAVPAAKTTQTTFTIGVFQSSGAIPYPGPTVAVSTGTYAQDSFANPAFPGVPLTLTSNITAIAVSIFGAGTGTTPAITVTANGGTGPYFYAWSNESGTVTFSSAITNTTTLSRVLTNGETASGQVMCTVTDSFTNVAYIPVVWSMNSNIPNLP